MDADSFRTRGISRRTLLQSAALGAVGLGTTAALGGCGSPLAAGLAGSALDPGVVTFWNLFGGGDGVRLTTMLDAYRTQHGAGSLTASTFAWGDPYYTKLTLATVGQKAPNVAVAHLTRMQNLAAADLLTPITDAMLSSVGLAAADFNQNVWKSQQRDGKNYAIPLDTHPFVLFYNVEVCRKAGLLTPEGALKPIQGVAEWEAALTAAQKATGAYALGVANVNEYATPWRMFQTFYSQMDGNTPFLGDNGKTLTLNEDLAVKTLAYIQRMSAKGWIPKTADYGGSETMMFTGKAAFYLQGEWELTTAQAVPGLKFGMAPIPQLFDKKAVQADSHTFVLPKLDRTPEQLTRDMGFIKFMMEQSVTWAKGGHIPSYLPTLSSADYKALEPQASYASVADYTVFDSLAWYSGSGSSFENIVGSQIGLVQQGLSSPTDALSSIRKQLGPYLSAANPL
ncbi:extracellular solute-binding protein [Lapillicoccus sp.]|uniref:extracellular solute-binding protein n=1 Tax=Lapillicoccus sp. TaxID=1909287 RepID=UPI0025E14DE4|nr:extracellular solute-binding protein [Lapillicoccus sp.]